MDYEMQKRASETSFSIRRSSKRTRIGSRQLSSSSLSQYRQIFFNPKYKPPKNWKILNDSPRIYLIENLLSATDLNDLDSLISRKIFHRSHTDRGSSSSEIYDDASRTSTCVSLEKRGTRKLLQIESRVASFFSVPPDNVEPFQVVSYRDGQKFDLHHDLGPLNSKNEVEIGEASRFEGKRLLTIFVYLNTIPPGFGGETEFPLCNGEGDTSLASSASRFPGEYDDRVVSDHLKVRPRAGCGLVFGNLLENGITPDKRVIHKASPVRGIFSKYGMNVWISTASQLDYVVAGSISSSIEGEEEEAGVLKEANVELEKYKRDRSLLLKKLRSENKRFESFSERKERLLSSRLNTASSSTSFEKKDI